MYTLILTLSNDKGIFIHSVPGFASYDDADTAGTDWQTKAPTWSSATYVIAKMG